MGRAPCCEKIGLKKGPWTPEEDTVLINFIQNWGHGNWRALPKLAGLLRCGKSCRLRWTNYLRPDIKRGNFTREEEDTIIHLHQVLGNRWSAIAAKLPGRTDNEIKNVWHTHLKKRLDKNKDHDRHHSYNKSNPKNKTAATNVPAATATPPPPPSSSCNYSEEMSSSITGADASSSLSVSTQETSSSSSIILHDSFPPIIDDTFWSEEASDDQLVFPTSKYMYHDDAAVINNMISNTDNDPLLLFDHHDEFQMSTGHGSTLDPTFGFIGGDKNNDDTMDFWYNIFMGTEDIHLAS